MYVSLFFHGFSKCFIVLFLLLFNKQHSLPTDILMITVLVAQSLLKLEPFLFFCGTCMFLYFFMDFLNVLLYCPYFFNKQHSLPTEDFVITVLVAQSLLKLEPFLLCSSCMFLYFFMDFLNVVLCCPYFFLTNNIHCPQTS